MIGRIASALNAVFTDNSFPRILLACVAFMATIGVISFVMSGPREGTNMRREDCPISSLPTDAHNVSYSFPLPLHPNTFYEFDTSPQGFESWVEYWMDIYALDYSTGVVRAYRHNHETGQSEQIEIQQGLKYFHIRGDSGVHLTYDTQTGRAYFFSHTR